MSTKRERRTKSQDERLVGFWNSIDAAARARALRVLAAMEGYTLIPIPSLDPVPSGSGGRREDAGTCPTCQRRSERRE